MLPAKFHRRIQNEKKILKQIADEATNMHNDIKKESVMRKEKMQDLEDCIQQDTEMTTRFLDKFE